MIYSDCQSVLPEVAKREVESTHKAIDRLVTEEEIKIVESK